MSAFKTRCLDPEDRIFGDIKSQRRFLKNLNSELTVHCSMILNGNIFQTAPSSEFRTGSSLEKYVQFRTKSSLEFRTGVSLEFVFFHMIEYIAKKNIEYFHYFIALDILQRKDGYYLYMNTIHRIA